MKEPAPTFSEQIEAHKSAERVSGATTTIENKDGSRLSIRSRGCFITEFSVKDEVSGESIPILYSDKDLTVAKLTASHSMMPAGPSEGIGGQHGFPRWADYRSITDSSNEQTLSFEAIRPDTGLELTRTFEIDANRLVILSNVINTSTESVHTSLGEHLYFSLPDEIVEGLKVDGQSLDELLGDGAEASIMSGEASFWSAFTGNPDSPTQIDFPDGRKLALSAKVLGAPKEALGMLIWHRPGSPSICFEPTVGFTSFTHNTDLIIDAQNAVGLVTAIEALPSNR